MKTSSVWVFVGLAVCCFNAQLLRAGPSLPVTKPPVQPVALLTGPPIDPTASNGQWFVDSKGVESVRTNEFHDNLTGGWAGPQAISGYVDKVVWGLGIPPPIIGFSITATLINDTGSASQWVPGNNSHGESLIATESYTGPLVDTKLVAEFAVVDTATLPSPFQSPYRDRQPYIVADNEDQAAWYCWNPDDENQAHQPKGNYFVPTWDFGTILSGQSATRQMQFSIPAGLPSSDSRYAAILASYSTSNDILQNRSTSLKISTWIDDVALDTGSDQEEFPLRHSDVSVFHNQSEAEDWLDFGDANDPSYPTLLANNGARHIIVPGVFLGQFIDGEADGQPTPNADGDDVNPPFGLNDEDGVSIPRPLIAGSVGAVQVVASVAGFLNAWIDFNANGTWLDVGEQIFVNLPLNPGINMLSVPVPFPPATVSGGPHSRWRFTTYAPPVPFFTGLEMDGEVEDYEVQLEVLDFGDAPDPAYPTRLSSNGARHRIPSRYWLGVNPPDADPDGLPNAPADGDDRSNVDDEDGVATVGALVQGSNGTLRVVASTNGYLNAWIDFNQDSDWMDSGEQVATGLALGLGTNSLTFAVPVSAQLGPAPARFRFSSGSALGDAGLALDGEVEDHVMTLCQQGPSTNIVITNVVYRTTNQFTLWWEGESNVTYQTESVPVLTGTTSPPWTAWGSAVTGAPFFQTDTNTGLTTKFYRVTAPFSVGF